LVTELAVACGFGGGGGVFAAGWGLGVGVFAVGWGLGVGVFAVGCGLGGDRVFDALGDPAAFVLFVPSGYAVPAALVEPAAGGELVAAEAAAAVCRPRLPEPIGVVDRCTAPPRVPERRPDPADIP
jgi:hypothetical protein